MLSIFSSAAQLKMMLMVVLGIGSEESVSHLRLSDGEMNGTLEVEAVLGGETVDEDGKKFRDDSVIVKNVPMLEKI